MDDYYLYLDVAVVRRISKSGKALQLILTERGAPFVWVAISQLARAAYPGQRNLKVGIPRWIARENQIGPYRIAQDGPEALQTASGSSGEG